MYAPPNPWGVAWLARAGSAAIAAGPATDLMKEIFLMQDALTSALTSIATFVPKLVLFLVILLIGWLIAKALAKAVSAARTRLGLARAFGPGHATSSCACRGPSGMQA